MSKINSALREPELELISVARPQINNLFDLWLLANDWSVHPETYDKLLPSKLNTYYPRSYIDASWDSQKKISFINDIIQRSIQRFCSFGMPNSVKYLGIAFTLEEVRSAHRGHATNYNGIYSSCYEGMKLVVTTDGGHRVLGQSRISELIYDPPSPKVGGIHQIFEKIF